MNIRIHVLVGLLFAFISTNNAQMNINGQTFYGNEWIDYNKTYYKIKVAEDGIYKIDFKLLEESGFYNVSMDKNKIQLFNAGKEVPVFIYDMANTENVYILFYGEKNRVSLDTFLYDNWKEELLNPNYSLFTDTSAYYLTYDPNLTQNALRINLVTPDYQNILLDSVTHFYREETRSFNSFHYKPVLNSQNYRFSHFVKSEGFMKNFSINVLDTILCQNFISSDTLKAEISFNIATNSNNINYKNFYLNNEFIGIDETRINNIARPVFNLNSAILKEQNILKINTNSATENFGLASVSLKYPARLQFENIEFVKVVTKKEDKYFKLRGIKNPLPFIYEKNNKSFYKTNDKTNFTELLINENRNKELIIQKEIYNITSIERKKFTDFKNLNIEYLIISSKKFFETEGGENNIIEEYKEHKSSVEGGGFRSEVVYDDEIYEQFGYGISYHPHSFKNFSHFIQKNWKSLEYVFLIGKGLEYTFTRTNEQLKSPLANIFFLPTYGIFPSDVLLFSEGKLVETKFAIGRLAAINMLQIKNYLEKLKIHDQVLRDGNAEWQKQIIHLGGGEPGKDQVQILFNLTQMENLAMSPKFGGEVHTFKKENSSETAIANLDQIFNLINNGVSIINFHGHASVGIFDFNLDNPVNYRNEGKLPFIFSLGCYSGNICSSSTAGVSEQFILIKDKGAVGFVAASGAADLNSQGIFGINFYRQFCDSMYGMSVGKILQKLNTEYNKDIVLQNGSPNVYLIQTLAQQLMFHGDPSIKFASYKKPDYLIDVEKLSLSPNPISIEKDSFDLNLYLKNKALAIDDSFNVEIIHYAPDKSIVTKIKFREKAPFYYTPKKIRLPLAGRNLIGQNRILIKLDVDNEIEELDENNNDVLTISNEKELVFYILSNDIIPLMPCEFGIVGKKEDFKLMVSSINAFDEKNEAVIQIDTTILFNSPLMVEKKLANVISQAVWTPDFPPINNTTYYWRVGKINNNVVTNWVNSSFSYVENAPEGWRQQHHFQYLQNDNFYIDPLPNNRFKFGDLKFHVNVKSQRYVDNINEPITTVNSEKWTSTLSPFRGNVDAINVIVWSKKGIVRNKTKKDFGSIQFSNLIFPFDVNTIEGRKGLHDLLETVEDSMYVFIFSYIKSEFSTFNIDQWDGDKNLIGYTLYETLAGYGAEQFIKYKDQGPLPYIFLFRKGSGIRNEIIGNSIFDFINFSYTVDSYNYLGDMKAEVGPVEKWFTLDPSIVQQIPKDSVAMIDLYLIDKNNNKTLYKSNIVSTLDISEVNADEFPKLELKYNALDFIGWDPSPLNHWSVYYKDLPDIFLIQNASDIPDTIDRGQLYKLPIKIGTNAKEELRNINIKLQLLNEQNIVYEITKSIPLLTNDVFSEMEFDIDTKDIFGNFQIVVNVNYDSLSFEKLFINNIGVKNIYIKPDKINPILDVTFDGIRILDGDIINPEAIIQINVNDENKYLLLQNRDNIVFEIRNTSSNEIVNLEDDQIVYDFPTAGEKNIATVKLFPDLEDGDYYLKAYSSDFSGNGSGNLEYSVNFKVINKKEIGNFVNYPNPFSTSTRFVFNLTGAIPENIVIRIMTLTGKVVKEITSDQIGFLKIGNNITSYAWDGRDEYGNKLGNGVYLYSITTSDKEFEINSKFLSKGIGKLVIMR